MFCPNCDNALADDAAICPHCGKPPQGFFSSSSASTPPQQAASFSALRASQKLSSEPGKAFLSVPQTPPLSRKPDSKDTAAIDTLWQEFMVQREQHRELAEKQRVSQQELTQLRGEIARISPPESETPQTARRIGVSSSVLLLLFLLALGGFSWFLYQLVNARADLRFDNISVLSTTLTVIGSFYLAYDLLGRQRGPLLWISLFVTGGLLGGMVGEPIVLLLLLKQNINVATQFLLASVVQGAFAGILFSLEVGKGGRIFSLRKGLIGIVFSTVFWGMLLAIFLPAEFVREYVGFFGVVLLLSIPSGLLIGGFHLFCRGKHAKEHPNTFSLIPFLKALLILIPIWGLLVIYFALQGGHSLGGKIINILVIGILLLTGGIPGGFARYTFWSLNHLPERVLGAAGFILTIIGTLLSLIQPLGHILAATPQ